MISFDDSERKHSQDSRYAAGFCPISRALVTVTFVVVKVMVPKLVLVHTLLWKSVGNVHAPSEIRIWLL